MKIQLPKIEKQLALRVTKHFAKAIGFVTSIATAAAIIALGPIFYVGFGFGAVGAWFALYKIEEAYRAKTQ